MKIGGEFVYDYVRLVRGGEYTETPDGDPNASDTAPIMESQGAGGSTVGNHRKVKAMLIPLRPIRTRWGH